MKLIMGKSRRLGTSTFPQIIGDLGHQPFLRLYTTESIECLKCRKKALKNYFELLFLKRKQSIHAVPAAQDLTCSQVTGWGVPGNNTYKYRLQFFSSFKLISVFPTKTSRETIYIYTNPKQNKETNTDALGYLNILNLVTSLDNFASFEQKYLKYEQL